MTYSMSKNVAALAALIFCCHFGNTAQAQYYTRHYHWNHNHGTSHHHHDAMGHRVDDAGHHIDTYGRHTGAVGVYENGAYSVPVYSAPIYQSAAGSYPSNAYYPGTSTVVSAPQVANRAPQNVIPGRPLASEPITLWNPIESGGDVRYSLNGQEYSIRPGQAQSFINDRVWTVSFGSGGANGDIRYTLNGGTFKFKVTEGGWNLLRTTDPIPLPQASSNPANSPSVPMTINSRVPAPIPQPDGTTLVIPPTP